jgi:hypothetical protein
MTAHLSAEALQTIEETIDRALACGDESGVHVLGYGEISTVVAWRDGERELACKRLPPFPGESHLNAYRAGVDEYLVRLRECRVHPVETHVQHRQRNDGRLAAYCIQPRLSAESLLPTVFARSSDDDALALFDRLAHAILDCVSPRLGLDGQISNWAIVSGELLYFDVSTPLMRDASGRERLDTDLFLSSLPWALRGLVRRFMLGSILNKYYDPRGVVVDLLANLHKERLSRFVPTFLARANQLVQPAVTEAEILRYYRDDAGMWTLLQRLRRMDRWWQRRIRRRPYPFLLPGTIDRHV